MGVFFSFSILFNVYCTVELLKRAIFKKNWLHDKKILRLIKVKPQMEIIEQKYKDLTEELKKQPSNLPTRRVIDFDKEMNMEIMKDDEESDLTSMKKKNEIISSYKINVKKNSIYKKERSGEGVIKIYKM